MKNLIFSLTLVALTISPTFAQPDTLWTRTYGGIANQTAYCVQKTPDGGYILVGDTDSIGASDQDVYAVKTDSLGNLIWEHTYGDTLSCTGFSVALTSDGGYAIVGRITPAGTIHEDVYLIKLDGNGDTLWTKTYGGDSDDVGRCIQQTTDGGYIICGYTRSFGAGYEDMFLIKTDDEGDVIWINTFGGSEWESSRSVQQTTDGGYILTGYTDSFGLAIKNLYLVKTDSNGDTLWTRIYALTGGTNWGKCVKQCQDGGFIITGETGYFPDHDVFLIKTDSAGDTIWTKTYGGNNKDIGHWVEQTTDGGYIVAGETWYSSIENHGVYVVRTDSNGDSLWTQIYTNEYWAYGYSVQQTIDGGYVVAGSLFTGYSATHEDFWLIRLEAETPSDISITLTPQNPPIQIPAGGGTFDFNVEMTNSGTSTRTFDVWTMATLPNGSEYGPIIYVQNITLNAGQSVDRDRQQYVPINAPAGNYTYDGYIGNYPNIIWDEDHFEFTKLQSNNAIK